MQARDAQKADIGANPGICVLSLGPQGHHGMAKDAPANQDHLYQGVMLQRGGDAGAVGDDGHAQRL